ncbi:MAG: hypothetical protein K1X94_32900, partial [Sandaracinaceae bacterium]|nr:hypothetical protein [Sandaracinaceae bacterium]
TLLARALESAELDLLVLGALADRLRAAERGEVVRLHLDRPGDDGVKSFGKADLDAAGDAQVLLRRIAVARLSGERGAPLRVDAEGLGLQLAQLALAYGADEIVVPLGKLSLEVFGGDDVTAKEKAVLRERELCTLIRCAGRAPRIVEHRSGVAVEREPDTTTRAQKKFRAPGREARENETGEA